MKITLYDHGLCSEIAVTLAQAGHTVAYYTPWTEAFPKSSKCCIGKGLEGVERVDDFWSAAMRSDLVCCFDTFSKDIVLQCERLKLPVFGAGHAEQLEHDRSFTKELQKRLGLPTGPYIEIKGINKLIEHLQKVKDVWVKIDKYRGDVETFHHESWPITQADILGPLLSSFGPNADSIQFLVEEPIEGDVEVGYDGFVLSGQYSDPCIIGYEDKDKAYIGKVTQYKDVALPIKLVNDKLLQYFAQKGTRSIFSTEVRIGTNNKGYLIDPCVRAPHPPLAVELELYENFANMITNPSTKPDTAATYGCAVEVKSDWVAEHWCEVEFDQKYRHLVKLQQACRINGHYYALPGSFVVCTVVGLGNTIDAAEKECRKALETVKCRGMSYDLDSLNKIRTKYIPAGEKVGVKF